MNGKLEILCPHPLCDAYLKIRYEDHSSYVLRCHCHGCWFRLSWRTENPTVELTEAPPPEPITKPTRKKPVRREKPGWMKKENQIL